MNPNPRHYQPHSLEPFTVEFPSDLAIIERSCVVAEDWGFNAFFNDKTLKNPYHDYDEENKAWNKGWTRAQDLFIRLSEAYGFIPE